LTLLPETPPLVSEGRRVFGHSGSPEFKIITPKKQTMNGKLSRGNIQDVDIEKVTELELVCDGWRLSYEASQSKVRFGQSGLVGSRGPHVRGVSSVAKEVKNLVLSSPAEIDVRNYADIPVIRIYFRTSDPTMPGGPFYTSNTAPLKELFKKAISVGRVFDPEALRGALEHRPPFGIAEKIEIADSQRHPNREEQIAAQHRELLEQGGINFPSESLDSDEVIAGGIHPLVGDRKAWWFLASGVTLVGSLAWFRWRRLRNKPRD
jgi:hypothetical protein